MAISKLMGVLRMPILFLLRLPTNSEKEHLPTAACAKLRAKLGAVRVPLPSTWSSQGRFHYGGGSSSDVGFQGRLGLLALFLRRPVNPKKEHLSTVIGG